MEILGWAELRNDIDRKTEQTEHFPKNCQIFNEFT